MSTLAVIKVVVAEVVIASVSVFFLVVVVVVGGVPADVGVVVVLLTFHIRFQM